MAAFWGKGRKCKENSDERCERGLTHEQQPEWSKWKGYTSRWETFALATVRRKSTLKLARREQEVREAGLVWDRALFKGGVKDGKELSIVEISIYVSERSRKNSLSKKL